jgi:nitrite reductase/ring-hydroxylating ferredoxin subunit
MYEADFDVRIGLHYGEAVIGSLGSIGHERLTAIGDVVNVASRVEAANKDAGTRFLITDALHDQVKDKVEVEDFVRVRLRGTSERITLHEVAALRHEADAALNSQEVRETMLFGGKNWIRAFAEDELAVGERRILAFENSYVVVHRDAEAYYAFNNACPHLHLPLFEPRDLAEGALGNFTSSGKPRPLNSAITEDRGVVCRWHDSCFDLQTGEVREWAARLQEDGTTAGQEYFGDISKNRTKLTVYSTRIHDDFLWIALD